jgi:citrate synthase
MNQPSEYVAAREAARLLGVKLSTLYAYVSRGLVRSQPGPRGRGRLYACADLERLKSRGEARAGHGPVAAAAMSFGEPVLRTRISEIRPDGPAYRGHSAVELARRGVSFEAVAELLISGTLDESVRWGPEPALVRRLRGAVPDGQPPLATLLAAVPRAALLDEDRFSAPLEAELARARRLVRTMAALLSACAGRAPSDAAGADTVAECLAVALGVRPDRAAEPLNRVLVLTADHELNASTFAARVVASTGADLYAAVTGGLAALSGPRHGALSERVEALLDEVGEPSRARAVVTARASRGEAIPGFGHPLYPTGDPRVPPLLELATTIAPPSKRASGLQTLLAVSEEMERGKRERPNLDFGLVAVVRALDLPRGSATALFAIGRTAGWIAHALEQRASGQLLRPRAAYVGE